MMTTAAFWVGAGRSKTWPSRMAWHVSLCSLSITEVAGSAGGDAKSVASIGHPAVTEPATTYLMKSRRDCGMHTPTDFPEIPEPARQNRGFAAGTTQRLTRRIRQILGWR